MAGPTAPLITFAATSIGALAALYFASHGDDAATFNSNSNSSFAARPSASFATPGLNTRPVSLRRQKQETSIHFGDEQRWARHGATHGAWAYHVDEE
ncbi:hypothetical protein HKX48_002399 [Thoreauomyces humboldtii]|nr:hypothetical protein HKX48_002399 [Thoreauomyces humboldtii]